MADSKKAADNDTGYNHPKRKTRKQIEKKLETALSNLKPILGEKKFKRRIKKAGKVLASGLKDISSNGSPKSKNARTKPSTHKASGTHQQHN
jgi:hypothetical protein